MTATFRERRRFLQQMLAVTAANTGGLAFPTNVAAAPEPVSRDAVIEAAKKESGLVWYDHYDRDAAEDVLAAFRKSHPFVKKAEFVDVPSAQKTAKIIQESMAGGPTADILLNDASVQKALYDRGFLLETDWAAMGVAASPVMTPTPYLVSALTPPYVVLYNTNLVKEEDVPKSWDEALSSRWKRETGHWMRTTFFVHLLPALGEKKVRELVDGFAALRPRLFDGLFPLAQAVGSGELALVVTAYDSAVRVVEKGAPVKMVSIDPTPFGLICGSALKYGKNPNTARLFLAWLTTPDGAITIENKTKRGNYFVEGTATSKLLKGRTVSYFTAQESIEQSKKLNALETEFSRKLAGR